MTGVNLPMPDFLAAAAVEIPTFAGIKFSDAFLNEITEMQWMLKDKAFPISAENTSLL